MAVWGVCDRRTESSGESLTREEILAGAGSVGGRLIALALIYGSHGLGEADIAVSAPVAWWCGYVGGAGHNPAMKLRRLRDGDVLEDGGVVLVRGGDLDPDVLCADAARYHRIYGVYGISVFAVRGATVDELAQQVPLVRFDRLSLLTTWCAISLLGCSGRLGRVGPGHASGRAGRS